MQSSLKSRHPARFGLTARTFLVMVSWCWRTQAADIDGTQATYKSLLGTLKPGDTLHLAAGDYPHVSISGLVGTSAAWITVTGPASGAPATFHADPGPCCNTVEISSTSYFALKNVTIDGGHVDGAFGISAASGAVHDILIEGCTLINHDAGQQTDGISTKVPTWGWIIRRNRIVGVGTGLYLGNSTGSDPFIGGVIENNLVQDPIGYCMEIKWQAPRPSIAGMPAGASTTIIRNNVFIKNDGPSDSGDRPNVLVGGFPDTGAGSTDRYEIYGNLFFHNPRESLLQASGRVTIHDNVFVDGVGNAILLQDHDLPLKQAFVYNNTVYGTSDGIHFGSTASQGSTVVGNLIFADNPLTGTVTTDRDNMKLAVADAPAYVALPSKTLGSMSFYPLPAKCEGAAMDLSPFAGDTDRDLDFNGVNKGQFTFRGAYVGSGSPGWMLDADLKPSPGASGASGGAPGTGGTGNDAGASGASGASGGRASGSGGGARSAGGAASSDGGRVNGGTGTGGGSAVTSDAGNVTSGDRPGASGDTSGCGCRTGRSAPQGHGLMALLVWAASRLRKRESKRGQRGRLRIALSNQALLPRTAGLVHDK